MALPKITLSPADIVYSKIEACIENEVYDEGVFGNCRWMYNPDALTLSLASAASFDRWANSRIIEIHPILLDRSDPDLVDLLNSIDRAY